MDPKEWLKNTFREESSDIPDLKRVKFSDVHTALQKRFPSREFSSYAVSTLIHENFSSTTSKSMGKARQNTVGLDWKPKTIEKEYLLPRTAKSEIQQPRVSSASSTTSDLLIEIQKLKEKIIELESKSEVCLLHQADTIRQEGTIISHGPDTIEAFDSFDIESVIEELKAYTPNLYSFFMSLGNTRRNAISDEISIEDIKATSS